MKKANKYLTLLSLFTFVLLSKLSYAQPSHDEIRDSIICPDYLRSEKEKSWNFKQRKTESEFIIKKAPTILQGRVLEQKVKIIEDALYMEILLDLEHSFRGITINDSVVSIYRSIHTNEPYKLVNGIIKQQSSSNHFYDWGIEKGLRYIFFCKEKLPYKDQSGFELHEESKTSYISELQNKSWFGLFCMTYLDYNQLINHFKEFAPINIPSYSAF